MLCSKCGNEMSKGSVPVHRGRLYWTPVERIPWNVAKLPKGSVSLSELTLTTPRKAVAFYCEYCEVVIIPVNKELK